MMQAGNDTEVFYKNIALAAIKEYKEVEKRQYKKAIKHNTSALLNHYLDLKYFFVNTNHKCAAAGESMIIESVRRNKMTCRLLMVHINNCLKRLQEKFSYTPVKYNVIHALYLDDEFGKIEWNERVYTICFELNISESTLKRYRNELESELSVILFGPEGLKLFTL